jgi:acyl-CoA reductase-like NAD-dependent aldehyde dehydrogenase
MENSVPPQGHQARNAQDMTVRDAVIDFARRVVHDEAQMPFGGIKDSGFGRPGGRAGFAEFTDLRWITLQTTLRYYPF